MLRCPQLSDYQLHVLSVLMFLDYKIEQFGLALALPLFFWLRAGLGAEVVNL